MRSAHRHRPRRRHVPPGRVWKATWASASLEGGADAQVLTSVRQEHAVPLTVKLVGVVSLAVKVPWKPNEVFAPGAMEAL
jgi:hypothetical protein